MWSFKITNIGLLTLKVGATLSQQPTMSRWMACGHETLLQWFLLANSLANHCGYYLRFCFYYLPTNITPALGFLCTKPFTMNLITSYPPTILPACLCILSCTTYKILSLCETWLQFNRVSFTTKSQEAFNGLCIRVTVVGSLWLEVGIKPTDLLQLFSSLEIRLTCMSSYFISETSVFINFF